MAYSHFTDLWFIYHVTNQPWETELSDDLIRDFKKERRKLSLPSFYHVYHEKCADSFCFCTQILRYSIRIN